MNAGVRITKFSGRRQLPHHLIAHVFKIPRSFPHLRFKNLIMPEHKVIERLDLEKIFGPEDQFGLINGFGKKIVCGDGETF